MRVVVNEALLNRNRKMAHVLFFVSLAGMGLGFFYTWTNPSSSSQISCLILPLLLFLTLTSVRMANNWIREPRPTPVLNEALKGLGQKYSLFHHLMPAPHVLIGPEGVFAIHTVWQERAYRVVGKRWYGDDGLLRKLNGYMRQDLIGNPFTEAEFEARQLQKLLDKIAPDSGIEAQPLVVLINPNITVDLDDPVYPVLYADTKKDPNLRDYLRDQKDVGRKTLNEDQLDEIDRMYSLITREEAAALESGEYTWNEERHALYATEAETAGVSASAGNAPADDVPAVAEASDEATSTGLVYVIQGGQRYNIGATTGSLDDVLDSLKGEAPNQDLEVIHTIPAANPQALEASLHRRFARKKQKGNWYGLSRQDITWLKSRQGDAG